MYALGFVAANLALVDTFESNERDDQLRAATGRPPRARRRGKTITDLLKATTPKRTLASRI